MVSLRVVARDEPSLAALADRVHRARIRVVREAVPETLRAPLATLQQRLAARFGGRLRDLRLLGSWARGEAHRDSDIDVCAIVDGLTDRERDEAVDIAWTVIRDTLLPLELLAFSTEHFERMRRREMPLAEDVDREGLPL
jgi:predicted nucleotidyltransferase